MSLIIKINDKLMNSSNKAIIIVKEEKIKSIYNYIDLQGIRQFLVYHPRMLLMFEILVHHIDDYVNQRIMNGKDTMNNSAHI